MIRVKSYCFAFYLLLLFLLLLLLLLLEIYLENMTTTYVKAYDVEYKIIIIGESRIGKTSILKRLETNQFHENTISTVGLDFVNFYHTIDSCKVKLQLWDTAGQERFRTITRSHFRNTKGIIFAFDISNKDSFDMLEYWFQTIEFDNNIENKTIVYLIGNKMDLEYDRDITYIDAKNVNYYYYFYTFIHFIKVFIFLFLYSKKVLK
jgi:small GTP-binding protein